MRIAGNAMTMRKRKPVEKIAVIVDFTAPISITYLSSSKYNPTTIPIFDIPILTKGTGRGKRFSMIPSTIEMAVSVEAIFILSENASIWFPYKIHRLLLYWGHRLLNHHILKYSQI